MCIYRIRGRILFVQRRGEYDEIIDLVSQKKLDPSPLISATLPLEDGPEAFARLHQQAEPEWIKVLLHT